MRVFLQTYARDATLVMVPQLTAKTFTLQVRVGFDLDMLLRKGTTTGHADVYAECRSPYGILLAVEVGQDAVSPLHLLHTLWPRNGLSRAQLPVRVCGKVVCEQLRAPTGIHPHHWIDVCRGYPEPRIKPVSPERISAGSQRGAGHCAMRKV